jgi:hypothetical protein
MNALRVVDWDDLYENNRTRDMKHMQWVPVPIKHDGYGYCMLTSKNGAARLGAWLAILQTAAKSHPRGTLLRDGRHPHTAATIAVKTRLPESVIAETIQQCLLPEIGWLELIDDEGLTIEPAENGQEENKHPHGEFENVLLAANQYDKLVEIHGKEKADLGIEELGAWMKRTGRRRADHYACLSKNSWVWEKVTNPSQGGRTGRTKTVTVNENGVAVQKEVPA